MQTTSNIVLSVPVRSTSFKARTIWGRRLITATAMLVILAAVMLVLRLAGPDVRATIAAEMMIYLPFGS